MTQAASYFTAAVPEPVWCLGLPLKDFSLGHYITLARFGSAFVEGEQKDFDLKSREQREAMKAEIVFAVTVCRFAFREFYQFLRQKDCKKQLQDFGKRVGIFSLKDTAKRLADYIKTASEMPPFVYDRDPSNSGAHWAQTVAVAVCEHCGYTQETVMDAPLKKVLADFLKHAENNGAVSLVPDEVFQ